MKSLARLMMVVLVALAVPLQGAAAVTAGQCMSLSQDGHPHSASSHSHADEGGSKAVDDGEGSGGAHCGPCTACCASASIAGPGALSILSAASNAPYFFSQFPPIGVQPDGVDRPPLAL